MGKEEINKELRAYIWKPYKDSDTCLAVIAESLKEAKKLGYEYWGREYGHDDEFTEQRCKLIKDAILGNIKKGIVEEMTEGLRRNLYSWCEGECPICKADTTIMYDSEQNRTGCEECLYRDEENDKVTGSIINEFMEGNLDKNGE